MNNRNRKPVGRSESFGSDDIRILFENMQRDPYIYKKVFSTLNDITKRRNPSSIWDEISEYPISEPTMTRVNQFMHFLQSICPDDIPELKIPREDILIWEIGTIIGATGKDSFCGKLKLHKMTYFFQVFFLPSFPFGFIFEPAQYGVFSYDVDECIGNLNPYIRVYKKREEEVEKFPYWDFKLTTKGLYEFQRVDRVLSESLPESIDRLRKFLLHIYQQKSTFLGKASKQSFVNMGFIPFAEPIIRRRIMHDVKKMIKHSIKQEIKRERSVLGYPREQMPLPFIPPTSIFDHGSYLFINSIPTNYVIPIKLFERSDAFLMQMAKDYFDRIKDIERTKNLRIKWIFSKNRDTVVKISKKLKEMRGSFSVREFETSSAHESTTDFSDVETGHGVILFDVTLSGKSLLRIKEELLKKGMQIEAVFTFADRQHGARKIFENDGVEFFTYLTKREIIDIIEKDRESHKD